MYKNINAIVCIISIDYRRKCVYNNIKIKRGRRPGGKENEKVQRHG